MKPRFAALVPMRHDSERVAGKNYRKLQGRPLCEYILETLSQCPLIDVIAVDTDSPRIREIVRESFPHVVLIDRPEALRDGHIAMTEVLLHDITQVQADFYIQTHSTNPLVRPATINRAIQKFLDGTPKFDSLFSVTPRQVRLWDETTRPVNHNPAILQRTQDLPTMYEENSCLYIFSAESLRAHHSRIGARPMMFPMHRLEVIDIDEEVDFTIAKAAFGLALEASRDDLYYFGHHKCATHWMRRFLKPVARELSANYRIVGGKQPEDAPVDEFDRTLFLFVNSRPKDMRPVPRDVVGFHLMRDPRDAFVSNYFSRRYSHGIHNEKQLELRAYLNEAPFEDGLIALLDDDDMFVQMDEWEPGAFPHVLEVKYEDLLADELGGFTRILQHLGITIPPHKLEKIVQKCSFRELSGGRDRGEEDAKHHYRKGVSGDWVNHMPPGSRVHAAFTERWGHLVTKFGYDTRGTQS
jgi:CMP-N-acetylneuraminic acid synthetase